MKFRFVLLGALCGALSLCAGCIDFNIPLFSDADAPLTEQVLQPGKLDQKVVVISIEGVISEGGGDTGLFGRSSGILEETVRQLDLAAADPSVKAVILKINSPGGTVTASDILYHHIEKFKQKTGKKVVVCMMSLATSGGYYVAANADYIMAHPTTLTGSVGVIFISPDVSGFLNMVNVRVNVYKSGANKDMLSPFRRATEADRAITQALVADSAERFWALVKTHRKLDDARMDKVKSAAVFSAAQAKDLGLIDGIGYFDDTIGKTAELAGLSDPLVVTFRRKSYPNDNVYNTRMQSEIAPVTQGTDWARLVPETLYKPGCYYLWSQTF